MTEEQIFDAMLKEYEEKDFSEVREFQEPTDGLYDVSCERMEYKLSKSGNPVVFFQFRIHSDDFKNQCIFAYFGISNPYGYHNLKEFVKSMQLGREIEAKSFSEFDQDIRDIAELATQEERGWALDMQTNAKGFKQYQIKEVFACS